MSNLEESTPTGAPDWILTYGDMMSLMLTFFVMLFSFCDLNSEEKYQSLLDSFRQQFGAESAKPNLSAGELRPRNLALAKLATSERGDRLRRRKTPPKLQSPAGDNPVRRNARASSQPNVGTVLYFEQEQVELDDEQRRKLLEQAAAIQGQSLALEIRGDASYRPLAAESRWRDNWDLAYERCRRVLEVLVVDGKVDSQQVRIAAAGSFPPTARASDLVAKNQRKASVAVHLLHDAEEEKAVVTPELHE